MATPTKTIDVSIPHRLGRDEARTRLKSGVERLQSQFGGQVAQIQHTWSDYRADFAFAAMGQGITGRLNVEDEAIKLSVDVPWMLAVLADKIKGKIESEGKRLLEKK
jgi:putative polyhydroxyalkanoate system protein